MLDLEYTAWEGSAARGWSAPGEHREVIQIGAVRLDAGRAFEERGAFDCLVRPRINPSLSAYITALTGITDDAIAADGVAFEAALARLLDFIGDDPAAANGTDGDVLCGNCELVGAPIPAPILRIANARGSLSRALGLPPAEVVSSTLPQLVGAKQTEGAHTGLGDARAIATALRVLRADGKL